MSKNRLHLVSATPPDEQNVIRDDEEYITAIRRGDEAVFTALVHAYLGPLTSFAFGCIGDEDAAHDVVQDVFARIWRLGPEWNPKHGVAGYLFAAVRNRAYDLLDADKARHRMQRAVSTELDVRSEEVPYPDVALVARVRRELHTLTDRQRDVLRLRYEQGHTVAQIAVILGVEIRAVEKLFARGLATLRNRLADFQKKLE